MLVAGVMEGPSEVPEQEGDRIRTLQAVPGTRVERRQAGCAGSGGSTVTWAGGWAGVGLCSSDPAPSRCQRAGRLPEDTAHGPMRVSGQSRKAQQCPHCCVSQGGARVPAYSPQSPHS